MLILITLRAGGITVLFTYLIIGGSNKNGEPPALSSYVR